MNDNKNCTTLLTGLLSLRIGPYFAQCNLSVVGYYWVLDVGWTIQGTILDSMNEQCQRKWESHFEEPLFLFLVSFRRQTGTDPATSEFYPILESELPEPSYLKGRVAWVTNTWEFGMKSKFVRLVTLRNSFYMAGINHAAWLAARRA